MNNTPLTPATKDFLWLHIRELPYFRSITRAVEAGFYQEFDLPSPILDIGCGDGHFASIVFDHPLDVGLDPWGGPIHEAGRRGCYRLLTQADGGRMPYPNGTFASAISNSVLEHIPHVDQVLAEAARVLKHGAPFLLCVPNPDYLNQLALAGICRQAGLGKLGEAYTQWFRKISRVEHADPPEIWQARLEKAGFRLERWWNYLPPQAWHAVEWGHYLGAPTLLVHKLTGRWLLSQSHWNLALTERLIRRYAHSIPDPQGTFTFYVAYRI
jgi:SAM-dependent methyltransferase